MPSHTFSRPLVVVSRCIEFDHCRYNGEMIKSEFVQRLRRFADFLPVCMEYDIGLGVPRDPIRVVQVGEEARLMQPSTGRDVTSEARTFIDGYLKALPPVDGFILKSRSPSCGIKDVKVYPPGEKVAALRTKENGLFGGAVLRHFSDLAVEDDVRLLNLRIGEHFLTKLFLLAELRGLARKRNKDLVDFHSRHKLLLMYYSQKKLKVLGNIVANREGWSWEETLDHYQREIKKALARPPGCGSGTNVLMHALGYVSEELSKAEKADFLDALQQYRQGKLPLTVPLRLMRSWIIRFEQPYLARQSFLQPFPEEFLELMSNDACSGRDLWSAGRQ